MTEIEKQEILDWIRSEHAAGQALNIHAVKRRRPDLLKRVYETRPYWGWWQAIRDAGLNYPLLKVDLEETVACQICGLAGRQINAHLRLRHGMTSEEYREKFPGAELASEARRAKMIKEGGRHLLPHWEPLYSDEYMMDRAFRYHQMGYRLRTTWVSENDHNLWQHVHRQGIGWEDFVTSLGIPYPDPLPSARPVLSREELLEGLRRVVREEGETPKLARLAKLNHLLVTGIRRYFSNYYDALEAADLLLPKRPHRLRPEFSPDEVLEELRQLAAQGARITAVGIRNCLNRQDLHHAIGRMGGYPAIRDRLGIPKPPPPREQPDHSREEVIAALRKRFEEGKLFTIPSLREGPDADPKLLRSARRHFRRWIDLLAAAGLEPEHHAKPRARRRRREFVVALRRRHKAGKPLDRKSMLRTEKLKTFYRKCSQAFKGWEQALAAAGLPAELADSRRRERRRIVEKIQALHRDAQPLDPAAMKASHKGELLYRRAKSAFPSWRKAVAAAGLTYETGSSISIGKARIPGHDAQCAGAIPGALRR